MVTVAILGVLAAVAIPAFVKYTRKAKTSEARQNIRRMYDGARSYYYDPMLSADGMQPAPHQFPGISEFNDFQDIIVSWPLGMASLTCCVRGGPDEMCTPDPTLWTNSKMMRALKFSMDDPHRYGYGYMPNNTSDYSGATAFTAYARGDLDCDDKLSSFTMHAFLDPTYADGPIGTGLIRRIDELE
jgi:type IV pilus assembly protein PilA